MATDKPDPTKTEYQHSETLYDAATPAHNTPQQPGIINPLTTISYEQMSRDVDLFVEEHGLAEHRDVFWKGALNARDPFAPECLAAMTPEEQEAMTYERTHRWAGSRGLYFGIFICALGAATQGWDQTGSNGANLSFPTEFGLDRPSDTPEGQRDEWLIGLINSGPYLAAGLIGTWLSDPLNHYLGRRGEVLLTSIFLIATPIGSGLAQNWYQLFIIRLLMGAAFGAKNATVPVFSAELAPARIRGALVMGWQVWVTWGIFLGFAANLVVKDVPNIAWRLQLGSAFIPAVPLALGIYFCPESPKWLMKHGNYPKAYRSYIRLRMHPIQAARDMYYTHVLYEEERHMAAGSTYFSRLRDCFTIPRIYRANMAATTVMLGQQTCGINIISFYSSTIFVESGLSSDQALFASLGYGALQFVAVCCVVPFMDKAGRRALLLVSFPGMAFMLFGAAFSFYMPEGTGRLALIVLFIYLFTIFYSIGEGPVAFMHSAEVFPTIQREQGMAWAVFVNNTFAGILGLTFPRLLRALGPTGAFCFYAALNLATLAFVFTLIRETARLTLEELDQVYYPRTREFAAYQTKQWLPYFIKRYIFRRKDLRLEPFYVQQHNELKRAPTASSERARGPTA